jgi:hypothetical protein
MSYGDVYRSCPDCYRGTRNGYHDFQACGLSREEHIEMEKLRKEAERQAHELVVQARKERLLPEAIIKAAAEEARRLGQ